jgi:lipoprotein signal peptidase
LINNLHTVKNDGIQFFFSGGTFASSTSKFFYYENASCHYSLVYSFRDVLAIGNFVDRITSTHLADPSSVSHRWVYTGSRVQIDRRDHLAAFQNYQGDH